MADRYNVDDILEEIKRKKSGAGSMISRQDAGLSGGVPECLCRGASGNL